jgi:hypothetical protein
MANEYEGSNRRRESWHLKKEVNISHLLTTIGAIASAAFFISRQDTRIALLEQSLTQQVRIDARQDHEREELKKEIKDLLTDIRTELRELRSERRK